MKEFVSHIDYLIQKHDCVIIPDFGGFVVNHEGSSIASDGSILPPKISVGFNPDLKSNDGLLAESYMTMYSIPYDEACQKIEESVRRLNTILGMKHPVQIGRLGKLFLENDRLIFIPNPNLSIFHPDTFGLSTVNMKRLSDIEKEKIRTKRKSLLKRACIGTGAAAAVALIIFMAMAPASESKDTQKSSILSDWVSPLPTNAESQSKDIKINTEKIITSPENTPAEVNTPDNPVTQPEKFSNQEEATSSSSITRKQEAVIPRPAKNTYYIIIGGAASQPEANRLIEKFESQGLNNLGSLPPSGKRIRIYVASFGSHEEADQYLVKFRQENPNLNDAWIYYRK